MEDKSGRGDEKQFTAAFTVSPGFEIFYALQSVLDPEAVLHEAWRTEARSKLPGAFFEGVDRVCSNPLVWANLADALGPLTVAASTRELLDCLGQLDAKLFARNVLEGAIHRSDDVDALLAGQLELDEAILRSDPKKRDWLALLGLYPFTLNAPYATFLARLIRNPEAVKGEVIILLTEFDRHVFDQTWSGLVNDMKQSTGRMKRLYATSSLAEFARLNLLRISVDECEETIRAVRGGYTLPLSEIDKIHFIPSTFNERRLWSAFKNPETGLTTVVFPCFDPELGPRHEYDVLAGGADDLDLDAALIFKALGDNTRYAIASMIAETPTTAVDIAGRLSLSRPTVSHHVQKLRLAGLIDEEWNAGSVTLSLRRGVIEKLSSLAVRALYSDDQQ